MRGRRGWRQAAAAFWFAFVWSLHYCSGAEIAAEAMPASCSRSPFVVLGSPFQWQLANGSAVQESEACSFHVDTGAEEQAVVPLDLVMNGSHYKLYEPGKYSYDCPEFAAAGEISAVEARHSIALCAACSNNQYVVRAGDVVQWYVAEREGRCTVVIRNRMGEVLTTEGNNHYQFNTVGTYELSCEENSSIAVAIAVVDTMVDTECEDDDDAGQYGALLYTHAGIMGLTFGILLPLGAFLAHHKQYLLHKITQPVGIVLALTGFVLVVVYVELSTEKHFRFLIHGVVGLGLMVTVFLLMPVLLLQKQWRKWHGRCGHVVAFFGMANVLLGLAILPAPHGVAITLCIVYGLWLVAAIAVYVLYPARQREGTKLEELDSRCDTVNGLSYKRSLNGHLIEMGSRTSFGRRGSDLSSVSTRAPQQLSKSVIDDTKMVQLRKKSMDYLEAREQREQLDRQLGLQDSPMTELKNLPRIEEFSPDPESSFDQPDNSTLLINIQASTPEPQTPDSILQCPFHHSNQKKQDSSTDSSSNEDEEEEEDSNIAHKEPSVRSPIVRAHSFQFGRPSVDYDSDSGSRTGSLRITRHSTRARKRADQVFADVLLKTPARPPSPLANLEAAIPTPMTPRGGTAGRRRKTAVVPPPIITTTAAEPSPFTQTTLLVDDRDTGGTSADDDVFADHSPKPRRKKVSVAQQEATVKPPTPLTLQPPKHLARSPSISSTLQVPQNTFADSALRSVMQIAPDAIVCATSTGEIVFWSPGAVKMFGYTPGEAIGSNLETIIPENYKEKHRNGIDRRTDETLKYIKKHSYAPEEQKHARLYAVHGRSKNGKEFPVEVNVTSFVLDGELFFTGVITELAKHRPRANSFSSASDTTESTQKQRALAVGAQMKIAHKLRSAEHISKKELERVLVGSLSATKFEVEPYQMEQMVEGIMKAGESSNSQRLPFMNLIKLLSKHRLYISESGLIARYGKTKGAQGSANRWQNGSDRLKQFVSINLSSVAWFLVYLLLNLVLLMIGVLATDREGWGRWAYGTGPALSMNCVLVLLPTLSSVICAMRNSVWMNKVFPLMHALAFHVIIALGILFWTGVHLLTHFVSFAVDGRNTTSGESTSEHFRSSISDGIFPTVTGFVILSVIVAMAISSVSFIRKRLRFVPFYLVHWVAVGVVYLLLLLHGVNYYNPAFWKWFIPAALLFAVERLYRYTVVQRHTVVVKSAGLYDDTSRVCIMEMQRPKGFRFEAGQFVLLNVSSVGYFNWEPCYISSGPKEQKLTLYIPGAGGGSWSTQVYANLKANPYNRQPANHHAFNGRLPKQTETEQERPSPSSPLSVALTEAYGPGSSQVFDYKISALVCGGNSPHTAKAIIKKFLEFRKGPSCLCGCHPMLTKLYFVWVTPSGNDFEWFTDYLSDLCEDQQLHRYLDIRIFLTNIDSPPDELASALLQLGLKTAGASCNVRRPSQPQFNNLYSATSYGVPDFESLLEYIYAQHSNLWNKGESEFGVFTIGELHHAMKRDLRRACQTCSKPSQLTYRQHHITT